MICPCFEPNPYTRMCVSTLGSSSTFGNKVKKHGKSLVKAWFLGFSLISVFSVYLPNLSLVTVPPHPPGPRGVSGGGGPRRCGRPRPLGGRPRAPRRLFMVLLTLQQQILNPHVFKTTAWYTALDMAFYYNTTR